MNKPNLGILIKPVSFDCNLACDYCYYRPVEQIYGRAEPHRMDIETFDIVCGHYMEINPREVKIGWQGGEPTLMGLDFFRQVIEVEKKWARPGDCIGNSLQTNGVLLDDDWCAFLAENHFLVGLSIDGPEELNTMRHFAGGKPAWESTMRAIKLLEKHKVEFNILVVVSRANVDHPREILQFLVDNDLHFAQFIPCTEPTGEPGATSPQSITTAEYGQFMLTLFDAWIENDDHTYYVRRIDNWLHQFFGLPPECCEYRADCSNLVTIEWNGDVYPCDFFVEPQYLMGNVREKTFAKMLQGKPFRSFVQNSETTPAACNGCQWLRVCHAGCYRHRSKLGLDNDALPYLCEAKKMLFGHVFNCLRDICNGEPGSGMHEFLNRIQRDVLTGRLGPPPGQAPPPPRPQAPPPGRAPQPDRTAPPRNAPCPCGSGRKFKQCCGARQTSKP